MSADPNQFNIQETIRLWKLTKRADHPDEVGTKEFIAAYYEVAKFFNLCGSGFSFVTSDVYEKLERLDKYHKERDGPNGINTLEGMMAWEGKNDCFRSPSTNGARHLLRLNRALDFIMKFIKYLIERPKDPIAKIGWDAYDTSLKPYHGWLIVKAVGLAVKLLPERETLLEKMKLSHDEAKELMPQLVVELDRCHATLHNYYKDNKLLELK